MFLESGDFNNLRKLKNKGSFAELKCNRLLGENQPLVKGREEK